MFHLCGGYRDLHCAETEYTGDSKLARSGQMEFPDLRLN